MALDNSSARWFYDSEDVADRRKTISSWFWCQLTVGSAMALLTWAMAPGISLWLLGSSEHAHLVLLVGLGIPISTGGKVMGNWLRYERRASGAMVFSVGQTVGSIGLILLLVVVVSLRADWSVCGAVIFWSYSGGVFDCRARSVDCAERLLQGTASGHAALRPALGSCRPGALGDDEHGPHPIEQIL